MGLDEVVALLTAVGIAFVAGALIGGGGAKYLGRDSKTAELSAVLRSGGLSLLWASDTEYVAKRGREALNPLAAVIRSSGFSLLRDETRRDGDSGSPSHS